MQGLAKEAGVSRQLVYEHFATLEALRRAVLLYLFEPAYDATRAIIDSQGDVTGVLRAAYELFLELPLEQQGALRALATAREPGQHALARAKKELRRRLSGLWIPYVRRLTGRSEPEARALAWMLIMAAWGLGDMIAEGGIERSSAVDLFVGFAGRSLASLRVVQKVELG